MGNSLYLVPRETLYWGRRLRFGQAGPKVNLTGARVADYYHEWLKSSNFKQIKNIDTIDSLDPHLLYWIK